MQAAVYRGRNDVRLETVAVPEPGPGEVLIQVHTCGICGTDVKKITTGSHSAPRIFGHETAGYVAAVGPGVREFAVGDRVLAFHHIPCGECYYCRRKTFAQCPQYKKVGCTAGFEPSGGGFAEYVRVMDWIVEEGTVRIPDDASFEEASFIEPLNTCLKALETVAVPELGPGEVLIQVHTCGICGTDVKKITTGSHSAPRIFGHETAGYVAAVGPGVTEFAVGDRILAFHHIPCGECYYCRRKTFAQCPQYKKVGCTAGFEPSGGGFAEYVRVMDWIVQKGVVRIPEGVSFEQACFAEPVNTCMKAIQTLQVTADDVVFVIGQGPIGIMLAVLARRAGARVITSDLHARRLTIAKCFGLTEAIDASCTDTLARVHELTEGRGANAVILAVPGNSLIRTAMDAACPGGRVMLFAQTVRSEATLDPAAICVDEKTLLGSYSASIDLQGEAVNFVFRREIELERLITHRFPLAEAVEALDLAARPQPDSMKLVIQPGIPAMGRGLGRKS